MRHIVLALLAAGVATGSAAGQSARLLDAIRQVESGGDCSLVGDGGKAIGPYQIHREYWADAVQHDPTLGGTYADCVDEQYARRVVVAYLHRYGRGKSDEQLARIHNGGPRGHLRQSTLRYWGKIYRSMKQ